MSNDSKEQAGLFASAVPKGDPWSKNDAAAVDNMLGTDRKHDRASANAVKSEDATYEKAHKSQDASWGDRWKHQLFSLGTYVGVNYFVNTLGSVALAYWFERNHEASLKAFSIKAGNTIAKYTGLNAKKEADHFFKGTKGFTLTMGGTVLLPVLKGLEDHRRAIEFRIGHGLDVLQDKVGAGNISTHENLQEYENIRLAIKNGKPVENISQEAKQLIGKQHGLNVDCDGKLSFKEHKLPWAHVIAARGVAWVAAFGTNNLLSRLGLEKWLNASHQNVTNMVSSKIPAYKKLAEPERFSRNLVNDALLCVSSSVTQPFAQKVLNNKKSRSQLAAQQREEECPPTQSPSTGDRRWAKASTDRVVADAMKGAESHKAGVEARRETAAQTSLA